MVNIYSEAKKGCRCNPSRKLSKHSKVLETFKDKDMRASIYFVNFAAC